MPPFKIVTWNVNSIRARKERLLSWLARQEPDVLCVQETKVTDDLFPRDELTAAGYNIAIYGQKTYNGVALIARHPITDVVRGFGDNNPDPQARFIGGTVAGVRVFSAYTPNGGTVGSDKYQYKLEWLARLRAYLDANESRDTPLALCGDWNVAPTDADVHDPQVWDEESLLCTPAERAGLQRVVDWGLSDSFRQFSQEAGHFTWWDYRMLGFPKNKGLRIDHIYTSEPLSQLCTSVSIDREERKGKGPSDHAPFEAHFNLPTE